MDAGTLTIKAAIDLSGIKSALDKAEQSFKSFGNDIDQQLGKLGKGQKFDIDTSPAENKFASLAGTIGKIGVTTAIAGTTAAVVGLGAALGKSVSSAADFETQMSNIKAVSGATDTQMQQLSATALRIGKDTSFSASEAADAIGELVKAGVPLEDVMNGAADAAVNLAAAGGVSIPEAATLASNAMNTFHIAAKDMGSVVDTIAGAANTSAIDVKDFGFSLQSVGAVANTVGLSFNDTATAIGLMGNAGIRGSDAGTSLKTMLMGLQPQTKQQIALFKQLGLITEDGSNQFFDATGNIKSMADIAGTLKTALSGMTKEQQLSTLQTLFGTDAVRAAAVMMDQGAEGVNNFTKAMTGISAADVAKTRLDNLQGSLEQMKGSLETLAITVGTALLPVLKSLVDGATSIVNALMPIAEKVAPMIASGFTAIVSAVQPFIDQIAPAIEAFFTSGDASAFAADLQTKLQPILAELPPLFDALKSAAQATITWMQTDGAPIIAALGDGLLKIAVDVIPPFIQAMTELLNEVAPTLQAISDLWHKYGDDIENYTGRIWNLVGNDIKVILDLIKNAIELVLNIVQGDWKGAWENLQAINHDVLQLILNEITTVLDLWRDVFGAFFGWIGDQFKATMDGLATMLGKAWDAITAVIQTAIDGIKSLLQTGWDTISQAVSQTWQSIQQTLDTAWNTITGKFQSASDGLKTLMSDTWTAIKTTATDLFTQTTDLLGQKWDAIVQKFTDAKATIQSALTDPFSAAKDALGGIMEGIKSAITSPWNSAANSINSFISGFAHAVDWISNKLGAGALIGSPPSIPTFAKGGIAPGGPAIVGEKGPELVILPKGATIVPANQTKQMLASGADLSQMPPDVAIAAFKALTGQSPQGAPIGTKGVGGGIFDAIGAGAEKLKDVTGSAMDAISSFVKGGVGAAIQAAFSQFGVSAPLSDSFLAPIGTAIFGSLKDALETGLTSIWKKVEDSLGDSDVINMALQTPGEYMMCEKFVGDVMQRLGRRYYRAGSAEEHSNMQPLNPGLGPKGAVVFFPWQDLGHVAFSGGDGRYFGTVPSGTGWSSGMSPKGWTTNPAANGGVIREPVVGVGLRSGQSYSFGERGPEWVTPQSGNGAGMTGNLTVNISVTPLPGQDAEAVGAATGRGFLKAVRAAGVNV